MSIHYPDICRDNYRGIWINIWSNMRLSFLKQEIYKDLLFQLFRVASNNKVYLQYILQQNGLNSNNAILTSLRLWESCLGKLKAHLWGTNLTYFLSTESAPTVGKLNGLKYWWTRISTEQQDIYRLVTPLEVCQILHHSSGHFGIDCTVVYTHRYFCCPRLSTWVWLVCQGCQNCVFIKDRLSTLLLSWLQ